MTFYAVGRSSESIFTTFGISDWDRKEGIWSPMWKELKSEHKVPMLFEPDVDSWKIDIFHCLACLLITSRSKFLSKCQSPDMINWIFPHYWTRKQPGHILNNVLKECEPHVESVCKGVTGSPLCGGTAYEMVYNNTCLIISTISRGGWDWKCKESMIYNFLNLKYNTIL